MPYTIVSPEELLPYMDRATDLSLSAEQELLLFAASTLRGKPLTSGLDELADMLQSAREEDPLSLQDARDFAYGLAEISAHLRITGMPPLVRIDVEGYPVYEHTIA